MWSDDLGGQLDFEDPADLGAQAVPLVQARARRAHFFPVVSLITPEGERDVPEGYDAYTATVDDLWWSHFVRRSFTWPSFYRWWVARRWVRPRDVRRG